MKKVFCKVILKDVVGVERTYRCCGMSQADAERKLLDAFPADKIVCSKVIYEYDEADYGWA